MICTYQQGFGQNSNNSYHANGLLGHTGIDVKCGFGAPITAQFSGLAYKVLTKENPANDGSGFTGVFQIVDNGIECFEWLVGHCNPLVAEGKYVTKGETIASEANHGTVYSDGIRITLAMQQAGDTRGNHRHDQKRLVRPVTQTRLGYHYLTEHSDGPGGGFYRSLDGFYYEIFNYDAGYHGCIDPMKPTFTRTLTIGSSGYDVFVLQRILRKYGFLSAEPTGYFGLQTLAAMMAWQRSKGLTPAPFFGPQSRGFALQECLPLPSLLVG